jgi:hypothetical protein
MLQKTRLACTLSILAVLVSCGGGPQSTITPPPPPIAHPPTPTTLRVLYRVLYSGTDRMTSIDFGERNAFPVEGQIYYVPDQAGTGRTTLNRYFNAGITDHADGTSSPAGYTLEETLGYPWVRPWLARRNTEHGSGLGRWRWVIERTFAWLNQFRRLRVRYEKRADIHQAFLSLGCALICWNFLRADWIRS